MKIRFTQFAVRVSLIYALIGGLWILLSGRALSAIAPDRVTFARWEIYKGWAFIAFTTLLLYWLLARLLRRCEQDADQHLEWNQQLHLSRSSMDQASDAIFWINQDGSFSYVNDEACRSLGYSREELLKLHLWDIDPQYSREEWNKEWPRLQEGGGVRSRHLETFHRRKDGVVFPVEVAAKQLRFEKHELHVAFVRNMTERKKTESALRDSERFLRVIMDLMPQFVFVKDEKSRHLLVNRACAEANNRTPEQMVGLSDLDLARDPAQAEVFMRDDQEVIATGKARFVAAERLTDASGRIRVLQTIKIPFPAMKFPFSIPTESRPAILGIAVDITELKEVEAKLRANQRQLMEALRMGRMAYWEYDPAADRFHFNDQFYSILRSTARREGGYYMSSEQYARRFVHPDDLSVVSVEIQKALATGDPKYTRQLDHRIVYADGETGYVTIHIRVEKDPRGRTVRTHGICMDITDRKRAEEAGDHERQLLRTVIDMVPETFYVKDLNGRFIVANEALARHMGKQNVSQVLGRTDADFYPKEMATAFRAEELKVFAGQSLIDCEQTTVSPDGKEGTYLTTKVPFKDPQGKIHGLVGIGRDITERKRADETYMAQQRLLDNLIGAVPDLVYFKDRESRFIRINEAYAKRAHLADIHAAAGKTDFDIFGEKHAREAYEDEQQIIATGKPIINKEEREDWPDGRITWAISTKMPLLDSSGKTIGTMGISRDITERKQAEEELRRLNRSLQTLSKCNEALVRATDEMALLTKVCQIITGIGGYRLAWVGYLDPNKDKSVRPIAWAGNESGYVEHLQVTWGDTDRGFGPVGTAIRSGQPAIFSNLAEHPDFAPWREEALRHSLASSIGLPLKVDGKVIGALAVYSSDVNAFNAGETGLLMELADDLGFGIAALRSRDQRKQLEEQLRQSQKMEAVGRLAGGVAHDFNNLLTIIQGNASLLLNSQIDAREKSGCSRQIVQAAERAADLTRQLLIFSRKQVMQAADVDLNEVVGNMTKMLRRILGEDVVLQTSYASHPAFIHADAGMIEQVLMNLMVNARDAMPSGGRLSILTGREDVPRARLEKNPDAVPGPHICLTVSDTGCGISEDVMPRIFEPFFTTKTVGKGTGLGLATVYSIVQQHRGWVTVSSEINKGTTFKIYFPAVTGKVMEKEPAAAAATLLRGSGTILVVEDEFAVRVLVSHLLQRCGYTVLQAETGMAALRIWQERRDKIELLLTDIIMPDGMNGYELARKLKASKPDLKVIYTSGYSGEVVGKGLELTEGVNFLQKPYVPQKLLQILQDNLNHN